MAKITLKLSYTIFMRESYEYDECPYCNGSGYEMTEDGLVECEYCDGRGIMLTDDPAYLEYMEQHAPDPDDYWEEKRTRFD